MSLTIVQLLLLTCCSVVVSNPTEPNGNQPPIEGNNNVVNMGIHEEQGKEPEHPRDTKTEPDENNNSPPEEDLAGRGVEDKKDKPGDTATNNENGSPGHAEGKATVLADRPTDQGDGSEVSNSQDSGAETAKPRTTHRPRDGDVDWGLGDEKKVVDIAANLAALDQNGQQRQQGEQLKQQNQQEQKTDEYEQQKQVDKNEQKQTAQHEEQLEQENEQQNEQQKPHVTGTSDDGEADTNVPEQHRYAHDDVGVIEPEHLVHGDDSHGDHHAGGENAGNKEDDKAEEDKQAQLRFKSEQDELLEAQPTVVGNVHDGTARKVAEFMKHQPFGPNEAEEAIHGGQHHVHDEKAKGSQNLNQAGDAEMAAHGEAGAHDHDQEKDETGPLSLDPEELMHQGQGQGHVHKAEPGTVPGAAPPTEKVLQGQDTHQKDKDVKKGPIGTEYETIIHDGEHVHGKVSGQHKPKNRVRYQDIIDLGLDQEVLKGIDLSKLLEQEKKEMEDWHRETESRMGEVDPDLNDTERSASFWEKQVTNLRKTYLEKLYAKVRHISNPDIETAEWEEEDDHVRGIKDGSSVHEGESRLEHEMEMWATTISKGARKPYNEMRKQWEKTEKDIKQEDTNGFKKGDEEGVEDEVQRGGEENEEKVNDDEVQDAGEIEVEGERAQENDDVEHVLGGTETKEGKDGDDL